MHMTMKYTQLNYVRRLVKRTPHICLTCIVQPLLIQREVSNGYLVITVDYSIAFYGICVSCTVLYSCTIVVPVLQIMLVL